jgi:hypothetical protein
MIPLELVHLSAQEAHVSTQLPAAGSSDSAIKIGSTGLQRTEAAVVVCDLRYESEQLFPRPPTNRPRSEIDDNKAILTVRTCLVCLSPGMLLLAVYFDARREVLTEPESLRVPKIARKIVYHFSYEIITFSFRR